MRALFAFVLLAPLAAQAAPLDDALARMSKSEGAAYLEARDAALALPGVADDIRARVAALQPSPESWHSDMMLLILAAHLDGEPARLEALQGLKPEVYLRGRKAQPMVSRELKEARIAVGAQLEVLFKTARAFPFAPDHTYPASAQKDLAELRAAEEEALLTGLVTGIAASGHPIAFDAVRDILFDKTRGALRRQAAVMLPLCDEGRAGAELRIVLDDVVGADGALRAAAAIGLGKVREDESLGQLRAALSDRAPEVRLAALRGLGHLGNRWVHQRDPLPASDALRRGASEALILHLVTTDDEGEARAAIESLGIIGHTTAGDELRRRLHAGGLSPVIEKRLRNAKRRVERAARRARP